MPHLNVHIGNSGPMFDVSIGVTGHRAEALVREKKLVPDALSVRSLIDTGASCTAIDLSVAEALQLKPTGTSNIFTPSTGTDGHLANAYDVAMTFKIDNYNKRFSHIEVVEGKFHGRTHKALIGRDILEQVLLMYDGPLKLLTLAF